MTAPRKPSYVSCGRCSQNIGCQSKSVLHECCTRQKIDSQCINGLFKADIGKEKESITGPLQLPFNSAYDPSKNPTATAKFIPEGIDIGSNQQPCSLNKTKYINAINEQCLDAPFPAAPNAYNSTFESLAQFACEEMVQASNSFSELTPTARVRMKARENLDCTYF